VSAPAIAMTSVRPGTMPAVLELVHHAELCLDQAAAAERAADRYVAAHLGALRAAAAVLAAELPARPSRGPRNVWELLARAAPDLREWAAFFAVTARTRAAIEAGLPRAVTDREADDVLRDAETFLHLVLRRLHLPRDRTVRPGLAPLRAS